MPSLEAMQRTVKLQRMKDIMAQSAPSEPPALGPQDDGAGRSLMIGAQGVGRGLADLVGGIPDLVNLPINAAIGGANALFDTEIPTLPSASESLADLFGSASSALGLPVVQPEDMSFKEKLAHGTSRYATSFGVGGALPQLGRSVGLVNEATPVLGRMLPARDASPVATAVDDVAMGAGAGLTATAVDEAIPDDANPVVKGLADTAATILGAVGGRAAVGTGRTAGALAKDGYQRLTKGPAQFADPATGFSPTNSSLDKAADIAQTAAIDPARAARTIGDVAADRRQVGDPIPTAGIASGDEGLIALENGMRIGHSAPFTHNDQLVKTAAARQLHDLMPAEAADLPRENLVTYSRQATDAAGKMIDERRTAARAPVRAAEQAVDETGARLDQAKAAQGEIVAPVAAARGMEGQASAQLDKAVVDDTLRPMTKAKNEAFDAIDPDGTLEFPKGRELGEVAKQIQEDVSGLVPENMAVPGEFTRKLTDLAEGNITSTKDVQALRPHLKRLQEQARQSGNFSLADNLGRLRSVINEGFEDLEPVSPAAAKASKIYKDDFAPRFAEGKGGQLRDAINKDDLARSKTPPTATAERFVFKGAGSKEAAADLDRILKGSSSEKAGREAVRDYLTASLARAVNPDGKANAALVRKWMQDHKDVLDQFPEVGNEFRTFQRSLMANKDETATLTKALQEKTAALRGAKETAAEAERRIGNDALSILVDREPVKAVAEVFTSKDPEKAFKSINEQLKGNKAATKAWQASIVDYLEQKITTSQRSTLTDDDYLSFAKAHNFFKKNTHVLAAAFDDPLKMNALQRIHKQLEPLARLGLRATVKSDTAENLDKIQKPLEAVMRWKYGHLRAGGIMKSIRLTIQTIPGLSEKEAVNRLVFRMQFEPELAQHLLSRPTAKPAVAKWDKKLKAMLVGASASREMAGEEQ